jgi:hypothetical protein
MAGEGFGLKPGYNIRGSGSSDPRDAAGDDFRHEVRLIHLQRTGSTPSADVAAGIVKAAETAIAKGASMQTLANHLAYVVREQDGMSVQAASDFAAATLGVRPNF